MAQTNDSVKTIRGSIDGSLNSPTSGTSSDDQTMAECRVQRFMSEETAPTARLALNSNLKAGAEAVKSAAKARIAAELLAFDIAFGQPETGAN